MSATCRTCLCFLNESNGKYSLMDLCILASDAGRFELMKKVMSSCSLTNESNEAGKVFICKSCVEEVNQMLTFLEKCVRSEAILREANGVKVEVCDESQNTSRGNSKARVKVESASGRWEGGVASQTLGFDLDDVPLSSYNVASKNEEDGDEGFKSELSKRHLTFPCGLSVALRESEATGAGVGSIRDRRDDVTCRPNLSRGNADELGGKPRLCSRAKHEKTCREVRRNAGTPTASDRENKVRSEKKPFRCPCGKTFDRKKKLEFHEDSVHEKKERPRKYRCPECDKKFLHPYALKNHANTHLGVKPFLCNACGSVFAASSNLSSHYRRVHSGEKTPSDKTYLCHRCGESFARASHLKRHTLRKHVPNAERNYECPVCKKRFLEKSDVTGHVKLHDDRKPFVCDRCSKCFRTSWRLQAHVKRVHLGLRPFECPNCSLKFKTKSHLEKHIRTHTGEKPFPCPYCTYACAEKSNLKKHINIHLKHT